MTVHLPNILPANFHPQSKIWIYQSNRLFSMVEIFEIETILEDFTNIWKSHGAQVKGFATILYGQFIILMADESQTGVGGCSTDSSVHIIKEVEKRFNLQMFNRELLAFWVKDKVQTIPLAQVAYAIENGLLEKDSLYFNNLVATKADMEADWLQPISQSWLGKKYIK
ncbi:MAG: hypothetical protein NTZ82_07675 [Bacteroidetes bacterium]|nr:hypothetical protein [Bacteroidota bacterium]